MRKLPTADFTELLCVIIFVLNAGQVNANCKYLKEGDKFDGYYQLIFNQNPPENTTGYVVGYRFNDTVRNITVFAGRIVIEVNPKLWFVVEGPQDFTDLIDYTMLIQNERPTTVRELMVNGKKVCSTSNGKFTTVIDEDEVNTLNLLEEDEFTGKFNYKLFAAVLFPAIGLGMLIVLLIIYVRKLEKMTRKKWIETFSVVLSIDRSVSVNNPNRKKVPLPPTPRNEAIQSIASYLNLQNYQTKNESEIYNSYNILLDALQKLDYTTDKEAYIGTEIYKNIVNSSSVENNLGENEKKLPETVLKIEPQTLKNNDLETSL